MSTPTLHTKPFCLVGAVTANTLGIGKDGGLPWKSIPEDMKHFQAITTSTKSIYQKNVVIMGRKTWESIPAKSRPLRDRLNVVLTRSPMTLDAPAGVLTFPSFDLALQTVSSISNVNGVFVIGGGQLYREAMTHKWCTTLELTLVHLDVPCDCFFPSLDEWTCVHESPRIVCDASKTELTFCTYQRKPPTDLDRVSMSADGDGWLDAIPNTEEQQYLDLVQKIIHQGVLRGDRTGTGTLSVFGAQMRFSLRGDRFPLLTTKRVFWRGVAEELLWFISGSTDASVLQRKSIHIWDGNASRAFLDKMGFTNRAEGDLGPVYGFQWRHFGATYIDKDTDYKDQGVDQLKQCIDTIRSNPSDRRIVLCAWNPADLAKMVLPPCHLFCQFYVANGEVSCQMYQRSADMGLGVPFNIASYALLTRLVAQVCGLQVGDLIHTIGDAHVYCNHIEALNQQLLRPPRPFPRLRIDHTKTDIDTFTFADFNLEGYDPHPAIQMDMAV